MRRRTRCQWRAPRRPCSAHVFVAITIILCLTTVACVNSDASESRSTSAAPTHPENGYVDHDGRTPATAAVSADTVENTPPKTSKISFTGDILPHSPLWNQAAINASGSGYDFAPMFADIGGVIAESSLAVCHLETPIAPPGEELTTYPLYGVPREIAEGIASAGYDRCSTASNHSFDRGVAGIDTTVAALEANGVAQSGMARTLEESVPTVFDVDGTGVAHLSYTYGYNGLNVSADQRWRSPLIDVDQILSESTKAKQSGAEIVILSLHWGTEYLQTPNSEQRQLAESIAGSGVVDLIIGHHAHVIQPIEEINGVWVVFGLGNSLSNMRESQWYPAESQDGIIVEFELIKTAEAPGSPPSVSVGDPIVRPTWVDRDRGWVIRDVLTELARVDLSPPYRNALNASLERTTSLLGKYIAS